MNSIETPFNHSDHAVAIDSKYYNIKAKINENLSLSTLHLNIASLSKHFDDLHSFFPLLKHLFKIIGTTEHKINIFYIYIYIYIYIYFNLLGYIFWYNETENSHGVTGFFESDKLTLKQQPDLVIDETGKLKSTFIELVLPNMENVIYGCIYKHFNMKTTFLNDEYLTLYFEE